MSDSTGPAAGARHGWFLEDAVPGTTLLHRGGRTIGADEHVRLAWLTDNASDVHGDAERAGRGQFGGPVVLGALTVAIVSGLAGAAAGPPDSVRQAVQTGWRRIDLTAAVLPGDTLRAASMITARQPDGNGGGHVERVVSGLNQRDETVVRIEERCWAPSRHR